jgi:hypothetical protein
MQRGNTGSKIENGYTLYVTMVFLKLIRKKYEIVKVVTLAVLHFVGKKHKHPSFGRKVISKTVGTCGKILLRVTCCKHSRFGGYSSVAKIRCLVTPVSLTE